MTKRSQKSLQAGEELTHRRWCQGRLAGQGPRRVLAVTGFGGPGGRARGQALRGCVRQCEWPRFTLVQEEAPGGTFDTDTCLSGC